MRAVIACSLALAVAGAAQAQGLRVCVVDAESGKPIAAATVTRWASQWQPRILRPPGKFWFPEKPVTTDVDGRATINKVAGDDWYAVKVAGYEGGNVERVRGKYRLTARPGGMARELTEQAGVVVVPLQRTAPEAGER